jgi:hypothetical protein
LRGAWRIAATNVPKLREPRPRRARYSGSDGCSQKAPERRLALRAATSQARRPQVALLPAQSLADVGRALNVPS